MNLAASNVHLQLNVMISQENNSRSQGVTFTLHVAKWVFF